MMNKKVELVAALGLIFFVIFILNSFMVRSAGDDYVYSFMWEGHSMYEPLSAEARRIGSFSDIAVSAWSYFLTWGGRIVAQSMAMFFLWMPRGVFNVAIALTVVLLVLLMQWTARGGKVTMDLPAKSVLITGFFLWTFQANFCGIFIWLDGSCNYLWPMVFLLAWLLPYIRHYMTEGEVRYGGWLSPLLFLLGLFAGNGNENTLCWIGLFGLFYLYHIYKKGEMQLWMLAGFLGLSIGYGFLMLSPGNLLRMEASGESFQLFQFHIKAFVAIWFHTLLLSPFYFYLMKAFRKRREIYSFSGGRKYVRLALWFLSASLLFEIIMCVSPEFPFRSLFPSTIFCLTAALLMQHAAASAGASPVRLPGAGAMKRLAIGYFAFTFAMTFWIFVENARWFDHWLGEAEAMRGSPAVLSITERPPYEGELWTYLTGFHHYAVGLKSDPAHWGNAAMARFYDIGGVTIAGKE